MHKTLFGESLPKLPIYNFQSVIFRVSVGVFLVFELIALICLTKVVEIYIKSLMNDFLVLVFVLLYLFIISLLIEKMLNKFIVCDCFLEIACRCLNTYFDKKNGNNSVFFIMNASEQIMQQSPFNVTYIVRCKDFVDFKIDLFKETSFRLTSVDCENTNEQQQDVDLDY